jgi:cullin 1
VKAQFGSNSLFQKALKDAFVEFVNRDCGKYSNSELLSSYCDKVLRTGGQKQLSDQEVEATLEKTTQLFSYLEDKDMFAEIYRNQLAKRLLNNLSASDEHEKLMVTKLKQRCGSMFTVQLEGMLNDMNMGKDHEAEFKEFYAANRQGAGSSSGVSRGGSSSGGGSEESTGCFGVQVLTAGYWAQHSTYEVQLPPDMTRDMQCFVKYYEEKINGKRRLQWLWGLGNAEVRGSWGKKMKYDLQVTTLQAVVLLDFNRGSVKGGQQQQADAASSSSGWEGFEAIRERLNLPEEALKRVMHSLSCGKYKVLVKEPASSNSVKPTDQFKAAPTFACKKLKVRIPMASLLDDRGGNRQNKHLAEGRAAAIEAAIVRIMKTRKTLLHQQLVAEVLSQLAFFKPEPKVVKRHVEALIDREYLERDVDSPNTYKVSQKCGWCCLVKTDYSTRL